MNRFFQKKKFVTRAAILFIAWNILYAFWLQPAQVPDWLLTDISTRAATFLLNLVSDVHWQYQNFNDTAWLAAYFSPVMRVMHACNALELYILYACFLFCMPLSFKRLFCFVIIGVITIFILNVFRIAAVTWLHYIHSEWTAFNHKVLFKIILYGVILFLWHLYLKQKQHPI